MIELFINQNVYDHVSFQNLINVAPLEYAPFQSVLLQFASLLFSRLQFSPFQSVLILFHFASLYCLFLFLFNLSQIVLINLAIGYHSVFLKALKINLI